MNEKTKIILSDNDRIDSLVTRIEHLITEARSKVAVAINSALVCSYYEIGRYIIENEQDGNYRAAYGKQVLKMVSERLTKRLGRGWSLENLTLMRKFYLVYSNSVTGGCQISFYHGLIIKF